MGGKAGAIECVPCQWQAMALSGARVGCADTASRGPEVESGTTGPVTGSQFLILVILLQLNHRLLVLTPNPPTSPPTSPQPSTVRHLSIRNDFPQYLESRFVLSPVDIPLHSCPSFQSLPPSPPHNLPLHMNFVTLFPQGLSHPLRRIQCASASSQLTPLNT